MPTLDVNEAARLAGRHPETVRRRVWTGRLRAERRAAARPISVLEDRRSRSG